MLYKVSEELNDPNGDIIIRPPPNQTDFRAFRRPLQHPYPDFSHMFHLLDLASASLPTVQMDETAAVVGALLQLSYPVDLPIVEDYGPHH